MNINHTDDQLMHHNLTNTHCLLDTLLWHWASVLRCASHHIMILSTKIQWWQQPRRKKGHLKFWFISALNMSIINSDWLRCVKWCDYLRQRSSFHTAESESDQGVVAVVSAVVLWSRFTSQITVNYLQYLSLHWYPSISMSIHLIIM